MPRKRASATACCVFWTPNLLRMLLGETAQAPLADQVWVLETNLDDVSGEVVGYCTTRLLDAGALDVYTTAIQMKKNRPAEITGWKNVLTV